MPRGWCSDDQEHPGNLHPDRHRNGFAHTDFGRPPVTRKYWEGQRSERSVTIIRRLRLAVLMLWLVVAIETLALAAVLVRHQPARSSCECLERT
jgi:hypothetical protein